VPRPRPKEDSARKPQQRLPPCEGACCRGELAVEGRVGDHERDGEDLPAQSRDTTSQLGLPGADASRSGSLVPAHPHGARTQNWPALLDPGRRYRPGRPALARRRVRTVQLGPQRPRRGRGDAQPRPPLRPFRCRGSRRAGRGPRAPQVHDRDPCHPAVLRRQPRLARRRRRRRTRQAPGLPPHPRCERGRTLLVRIIAALHWEGQR
jgi:hypothetical protein